MRKKKKAVSGLAGLLLAAAIYLYSQLGGGAVVPPETAKAMVEPPQTVTKTSVEGLKPDGWIEAVIKRVVDGDTLVAQYRGKEYKIRMLYVDTPESVKSGVEPQPYSREASAYVKDKVEGKTVRLVFEKGLEDRYDRLLAHVLLEDGSYVNGLLVRNGFARVEVVRPNNSHEAYFESLQQQAEEDKAGLWGLPEDQRPFVQNEKGEYVPRYFAKKKAA